MYHAGDGIMIIIFLAAGYSQQGALSAAVVCNNSTSINGTSGSACETTTSSPDHNIADEYCCKNILYIAIICFGVLTLPVLVCTRVCWIRNLRQREQRRLDRARNMHGGNNDRAVYTIDDTNLCDFMVSPPPYDVISASETTEDSPPPYDLPDLPPPYTAKAGDKEKTIQV